MQTTLRIDATIYREAKAEAARRGITVTRFIEEALQARLASQSDNLARSNAVQRGVEERDRLMEALLQRTARFRVGPHPTREELSGR